MQDKEAGKSSRSASHAKEGANCCYASGMASKRLADVGLSLSLQASLANGLLSQLERVAGLAMYSLGQELLVRSRSEACLTYA